MEMADPTPRVEVWGVEGFGGAVHRKYNKIFNKMMSAKIFKFY